MYPLRRVLQIGSFAADCIYRKKFKRLRHAFDLYTLDLFRSLKRCDPEGFQFVFDGGANHGQFSRSILRISPHAKVISVEPLAALPTASAPDSWIDCRTDLEKLACKYPKLVVVGKALADRETRREFFVTQFDQCSSLVKPPEKSSSGAFNTLATYQVDTTTIDNITDSENIRRLDLLKLDLQGGELMALRGGIETLKITKYVLVELNLRRVYAEAPTANAVAEFLHERGFLFEEITNYIHTADGSLAQCDGLFRKESRLYC